MTRDEEVIEEMLAVEAENKTVAQTVTAQVDILARAIWGSILDDFGDPPVVARDEMPTMTDAEIARMKADPEAGVEGLTIHALVRRRLSAYAHQAGADELGRVFAEHSRRVRQAVNQN